MKAIEYPRVILTIIGLFATLPAVANDFSYDGKTVSFMSKYVIGENFGDKTKTITRVQEGLSGKCEVSATVPAGATGVVDQGRKFKAKVEGLVNPTLNLYDFETGEHKISIFCEKRTQYYCSSRWFPGKFSYKDGRRAVCESLNRLSADEYDYRHVPVPIQRHSDKVEHKINYIPGDEAQDLQVSEDDESTTVVEERGEDAQIAL